MGSFLAGPRHLPVAGPGGLREESVGRLEGKTAIISGGSGGIGRGIAKRFFQEGCNLVLCARTPSRLVDAAREVAGQNVRLVTIPTDTTDDVQVQTAVAKTVEVFGGVDILVTVSGYVRWGRLETADPADFDPIMRTNVLGPWRFMAAVVPHMRRAGGGSIINVSSVNGLRAYMGMGLYSTSKAALNMLSQVMAMELAAENIRVNVILPGTVEETAFAVPVVGAENLADNWRELRAIHPMGRNAFPQDVANAAVFLASGESSYTTGTMLNVDGGRHLATNKPSVD
jgi:NAD(P)-dependent dehydrogenase (short-subunit alcohol dehydrogenase family)